MKYNEVNYEKIIIISDLSGCTISIIRNYIPQVEQLPEITKWYNNYDCAISLRFDDNLDSHVEFVIPLLNKYDLREPL